MNKITRAGLTGLTLMGLLLVPTAAYAVDPSPLAQPNYTASVGNAATGGGSAFTDNILYALLIPALWVGFKVVRRVVGRIG